MATTRRRTIRGVFVAVALLALPRVGSADPVTVTDSVPFITAGAYVIDGGRDVFTFIGPSLELHQDSGATPAKNFAPTCTACTAGDTVNLSFRNPPSDANGFVHYEPLGTGHGTVGDQNYPFLSYSGSLKFNATPTLFPDTDASEVTIATPFSFRGWLQLGFEPGPFQGGIEMRRRGLGIATTSFFRDGNVYRARGPLTYTFQSVTPEPSSMLLLGTGVIAFGRRAFRRMRREP